jgi:ribonuclease HII
MMWGVGRCLGQWWLRRRFWLRDAGLTVSPTRRSFLRKKCTEFEGQIRRNAVGCAVAVVDVEAIDRINFRRAYLLAMRLAVEQLALGPGYLLIDGVDTIDWHSPQQAVVEGDAISVSVVAASVLAKVHRDRMLVELDSQFPGYGLASHKGYRSAEHLAALARLETTPMYHKSFHPVAQSLLQFD